MDSSRRRKTERLRQMLVRGVASAKAGETSTARFYLQKVIDQGGESHQEVEALYYLSLLEDDPARKRELIENVLSINPAEPRARQALAILEGRLDPKDMGGRNSRADDLPEQALGKHARFECPTCGSALSFSPLGGRLQCDHCGFSSVDATNLIPAQEQDLVAGLATAKGHMQQQSIQVFLCDSCGAEFLLPPGLLSFDCPHCDANYSVVRTTAKEVIPPSGVLVPEFGEEQAKIAISEWLEKHRLNHAGGVKKPTGLYLPVWTFDLGGYVQWSTEVYRDKVWERVTGSKLVDENDLLIAANTQGRQLLGEETLSDIDTRSAVSYSPHLLAGWIAETLSISMASAAVAARAQVVRRNRLKIGLELPASYRDLALDTKNVILESYKLILVPLWLSQYSYFGNPYRVCVNAVSGQVSGELPPTRFQRILRRLFGTNSSTF